MKYLANAFSSLQRDLSAPIADFGLEDIDSIFTA